MISVLDLTNALKAVYADESCQLANRVATEKVIYLKFWVSIDSKKDNYSYLYGCLGHNLYRDALRLFIYTQLSRI